MTALRVATGAPLARTSVDGARASLFPTLWPSMLLGRQPAPAWPFPFAHPDARFPYLARYGIYQAAQEFGLAGREILFPAFFHCVELDALVAAGVRPRFFPVGQGLRVDAADVAARIGPQTAAVYLIHYGGFPGPVHALSELCRQRGLVLIEDCAHALLSKLGDRPLGSFGDAAVFSLPKVVPAPNGGIVLVRGGWRGPGRDGKRPPLAAVGARTVSLVLHNLQMRGVAGSVTLRRAAVGLGKAAFRTAGVDHMPTGTPEFEPSRLGLTMSRLSWRVLANQDFPHIVERRRRNYGRLHDRLGDLIPSLFEGLPTGVSPLFYPFQVGARQAVLDRLRARGVEIGEFWPEWHPAVPRKEFPEVDHIRRTALWLPCHQDLTEGAIDRLAGEVRRAVLEVGR